ncbi:MAG TPA: peroxiredoxin [Bryobacteraceae bacterium]|nr:peroxiredoxin [Bryobacteraceae bacterium]
MLSWLFSDPLTPGAVAPEFSLPDDSGGMVSLSGLRGHNIVLVFYPGDDTPGCTRQLCAFRDAWTAAREHDVRLFGVNPQGAGKHGRFRRKFQFPFPLLVDKGQKVAALYHANGIIVKRTVYLIGRDGRIRFARRGMPRPSEVLGAAE